MAPLSSFRRTRQDFRPIVPGGIIQISRNEGRIDLPVDKAFYESTFKNQRSGSSSHRNSIHMSLIF